MNSVNLSAIRVDMQKVSENLNGRIRSPQGLHLEAGEFLGKFYQLDWVSKRVTRITLGAYNHLKETWIARQLVENMK